MSKINKIDNQIYELINFIETSSEFVRAKNPNIFIYEYDYINEAIIKLYKKCQIYKDKKFATTHLEAEFCTIYSFVSNHYKMLKAKEKNLVDLKTSSFTKKGLANQTYDSKNIDDILEVINICNEVIEYSNKALDNLNKLDINKIGYFNNHLDNTYNVNPNKKLLTSALNDRKQATYSILSSLYFMYIDVDIGLKYALESLKYGYRPDVLSNMIVVYTNRDYYDLDKALEYYNSLLNYQPNDDDVYLNLQGIYNYAFHYLHYAYISSKMYDEALELTRKYKHYTVDFCNKYLKDIPKEEIDKIYTWIDEGERLTLDKIRKENVTSINLSKHFSDEILEIMSDDIKIFINTSIHMYEYICDYNKNNNVILDFSPSTIPIMKALESLLYDLFANHYLNYLKSIPSIKFEKIDKSMKYDYNDNYKLRNKIEFLEYGDVIHIVCSKKTMENGNFHYIANEYFLKFLSSLNFKNSSVFIDDFCNKLNHIRLLRNNTAHKNRILEKDANESFEYLLTSIKFINYIYENFKEILKRK